MIIYIDENMPPVFARGFHILQEPLAAKLEVREKVEVKSIKLEFGEGVEDEEWIPRLKGRQACVISQDYSIQRIRHQRELCEEFGLGMLYFRPPSRNGFSYWDMVKLMVKHWPEILKKADHEPRPFAFKITAKSSRLEAF